MAEQLRLSYLHFQHYPHYPSPRESLAEYQTKQAPVADWLGLRFGEQLLWLINSSLVEQLTVGC